MGSGLVDSSFFSVVVFKQQDSTIDLKDIKTGKNNNVTATLVVNAVYVPKIDTQKLSEQDEIVGSKGQDR